MDMKAGPGLRLLNLAIGSDGDFEFFHHRLVRRKRVLGYFLVVFQEAADVAGNGVTRHLSGFGQGASIGHKSRQGRDDDLVAAFGELLIEDRTSVFGRWSSLLRLSLI
jgi:hypothetical protein